MSSRSLESRVKAKLASREQRGILRRLKATSLSRTMPGAQDESSDLVDFSSNDYLSLASSHELRSRFMAGLEQHTSLHPSTRMLGSGGSRLLDGDSPLHAALEENLETFFGAPAALLFNSGYDANVGFFSSVPQAGDAIVYDALIHASVHDGMRASRVHPSMRRRFRHNSLSDFRAQIVELLKTFSDIREGSSCVFIVVESLYSMDGDFASLPEIVSLVQEHFPLQNAHIIVDEAHATGIYGKNGRGLVSFWGLEDRILARLHTFGKALGTGGAVILTTPWLRAYLINYARTLIYTTSMPIYNIIAMQCAVNMLKEDAVKNRADHLLHLSSYFLSTLRYRLKSVLRSESILVLPNGFETHNQSSGSTSGISASLVSPIVPLLTPSSNPRHTPHALAHFLQTGKMDTDQTSCQTHISSGSMTASRRYLARPIASPTVPRHASRVRICIHAGNTMDEVNGLIEAVVSWVSANLDRVSPGRTGAKVFVGTTPQKILPKVDEGSSQIWERVKL